MFRIACFGNWSRAGFLNYKGFDVGASEPFSFLALSRRDYLTLIDTNPARALSSRAGKGNVIAPRRADRLAPEGRP